MQSVHMTTKFVRSNLVYEGVLNTTLCDIKFVSDLHHVGGFLILNSRNGWCFARIADYPQHSIIRFKVRELMLLSAIFQLYRGV
jgi:hypothetical protein